MKHKSNCITVLLQTAQCCLCSGSDLVSPNLSSLLPPSSLTGACFRSLEPMKLFLSLGHCTVSFMHWKCSFCRPPWAFVPSHRLPCVRVTVTDSLLWEYLLCLFPAIVQLHCQRSNSNSQLHCPATNVEPIYLQFKKQRHETGLREIDKQDEVSNE